MRLFGSAEPVEQGNPSTITVASATQGGHGPLTNLLHRNTIANRIDSLHQPAYALASTAPAGTSSHSKYFQKAINSFRATATIPIRLIRLLPCPKRFQNHLLKALSGWKRSHSHDNSIIVQRIRLLPALLIP